MATQTEKYFKDYEDILVHELMLKDKPRVTAYKMFIENNSDVFQNKIVVDVGAGTGILSLLVAKSGAKHVFAVEASGVSTLCHEIVQRNGYGDIITVIQGRVEDVMLPENVKADVLISEWMGFYLLHESMLDSVISARDRFLARDGIILPSVANIYTCPVTMKDFQTSHIDYWKNVYGFDFSPAISRVRAARLTQPQIMSVRPIDCLAEPYLLISLDLNFVSKDDIKNIYAIPKFRITKNALLHGFAVWFDVEFEGTNSVVLKTGPDSETTHWCQTVIVLPETLLVSKNETVECQLVLSQDHENFRRYNISIEMPCEEEEEETEHIKNMKDNKDVVCAADNFSEGGSVDYQHSIQDLIQETLLRTK